MVKPTRPYPDECPYTWLLKYLVDRVSGRSLAAPVSSAGVQPGVRPDVRAARVSSAVPKKNNLIEAAPFGRLDQM